MPITNLPGVYYTENVSYELSGTGSKIPIFIGVTGNKPSENDSYTVDGSQVLTFKNKNDCLKDTLFKDSVDSNGNTLSWIDNTGIGSPSETNELANIIQEFYEESRLLQASDIGVPYIHVIDVGDGSDSNAWEKAINTCKQYYDSPVEVYVGLEHWTKTYEKDKNGNVVQDNGKDKLIDITLPTKIQLIADSISTHCTDLNLRYAFITKKDATDTELKQAANTVVTNNISNIQKLSRIGLCEPDWFGKTVARICVTPNNIEPGYYKYRSVAPDVFNKRLKEDALDLQNHGIIFNRDEYINGDKNPKLNLCVSLAFNTKMDSRPADSLFHARFNADDLLREVFGVCYTAVKANESSMNIAYLQTRINTIVSDRVASEDMIRYDETTEQGTRLIVKISDDDPYSLIVDGQIQPQKAAYAINVNATIKI